MAVFESVFVCRRCDAALTAPVSRVALPVHAHHCYGHDLLPPLMAPGTYAVDPEPYGPPWRPWSEIGAAEAAARGVYAPVHSLSFGEPGAIAIAPGDARGTVLIPERCDGYCQGLDGRDGPNLACEQCGQAVATRVDDCSLWQAVWLAPQAVRRVPADGSADSDGPDGPDGSAGSDDSADSGGPGGSGGPEGPAATPADWAALTEDWPGTPPVEQCGAWNPLWPPAVGAALAHLVAASEGAPVAVPDGLMADIFGHALDALLPPERPGSPAKRAALAGPSLPAPGGPSPDMVLVPRHPRTGQVWQPPQGGAYAGAAVVPLAAGIWTYLSFHRARSTVPAPVPVPITGGLPDGVLRDDPPPLHPWSPFHPVSSAFLDTLARLPAVRRPWLRKLYDHVRDHPYDRPF
ncbi:hypothetical protein AB0I49_01565 [Streptomyces sp. NPDC050617]|uniref:hypothetical protein n=1 Tax=Streptomyces sp. NPDC050617 TaxID=3154628 RepID=UPI00342F92B5